MILLHPWLLLLGLLIPLMLWLKYRRKRHAPLRFSDGRALQALPVSWSVRVRYILPILYAAGLGLVVVALARPQSGMDESRINKDAIDIVLLVDVSTSMLAEDFFIGDRRVNRMEVCLEMAKEFVQLRRGDRISAVAFAGVPYVMAPLTFDHGWLLQQINRIEIAMVRDGTAIGSAIASGLNRLRDSESESKVILLLTDGVNNTGNITPENAAQLARNMGIRIHTVGIGTQTHAPFPVQDPFGGTRYTQQLAVFDEAQLMHIADVTGGRYFHGKDTEALSEINQIIDELERTKIEVDEYTRYEERFMLFLMIALALLGLEQLLSLAKFGRWP